MRIVQVCPRYHPYKGGVERVVKNIAEYLVRMDHEVKVYATDPSITSPRSQIVDGIKLRNYPVLAPNEAYYLPHPSMLSDLSEEKMDILHAHNIHALTTFMAYIVRKLHTKLNFIVSPFYHGRGHTKLAQMLWIPYRPLAKKIMKNTDAIIVNSRAQRILMEKTFEPSSKIFIVYDGVNLCDIKNAKPLIIGKKCRILLYVGRLEKYKNVHVTITSMKHLPENYHLYIIGRGPFKPFLENLVQRSGLKDRVHFLGFQPDSAVYRWIKTAHVFVHLSAVESFGMTCIESLAAGTPVIANSDDFGLSETIALYPKDIMVFRVNEEPVSELARRIMEVAELKPTKVDVSQFSWEVVAEGVHRIYQQISENQ